MKKVILVLSIVLCLIFALSIFVACGEEDKVPTNFSIDDEGNLIVEYEDNTTANLGKWGEALIASFKKIEISEDNYYVINSIKTKIKAPVISSYYINEEGKLIAVYSDETEKDCGTLEDTVYNAVNSIRIAEDGCYEINGVKTSIEAVQAYNISFTSGYSVKVDSQTVREGVTIAKPTLNRDGYTLEGWYCNDEKWVFNTNTPTRDMTLEARWTANTYDVSFVNSKGSSPVAQTYTYDNNVVLPTVDAVEGYTFEGWYYNNNRVSNGAWRIADDVELTAKWSRNKHRITFDSNGGSAVSTMTVDSLSQVTTLPTPQWQDHNFLGWKLNNALVELPLDVVDSDIALVASWRGVTEDFQFKDETDGSVTITKYIGANVNVVIPATIANKPVKGLAENAFDGCSGVKSIVLPQSLVNLEYKSLYGCTALEALTISGNVDGSLKYYFGNDEANVPLTLKEITFAEGSTTYSKGIFNELPTTHLFKINLPASLKTTPSDAFYQCDNIEEAYVPEGVKTLSDRTFCACPNLKKVNIPRSCTSLGTNCFVNTDALEYLIVPNSVTSFGYASLAVGNTLLLFEQTTKKTGSVFSIYEDSMDIYYGFEEIRTNDTFVYALCKVGSVKQAIIISLVDGASMPGELPEKLDDYPVVLCKAS